MKIFTKMKLKQVKVKKLYTKSNMEKQKLKNFSKSTHRTNLERLRVKGLEKFPLPGEQISGRDHANLSHNYFKRFCQILDVKWS